MSQNTEDTPLMRQYKEIKENAQDAIMFFRMGDFYEMFAEDAVTAAPVMGVALTSRNKNAENPIPMCGIPYHSATSYIQKLTDAGFRVAICEQTEDPKEAKGIVKREIVRIVSPAVVFNVDSIDSKKNNYLMAVDFDDEVWGYSIADASTGAFFYNDGNTFSDLINDIHKISPTEILLKDSISREHRIYKSIPEKICITKILDHYFNHDTATKTLKKHFNVSILNSFGLEDDSIAIKPCGAILSRLNYMIKDTNLTHFNSLYKLENKGVMSLDPEAIQTLEIIEPTSSNGVSLLNVLDKTLTAMGGREIKNWLFYPLMNKNKIEARLDSVEEFTKNIILREKARSSLRNMLDIERLMGKIAIKTANARDLNALRDSFNKFIELTKLNESSGNYKVKSELTLSLIKPSETISVLADAISKTIADEPPFSVREGGFIKKGVNAELDEIIDIQEKGAEWLAEYEAQERKSTGIGSLKVRFNRVFGYYIEITKTNLSNVPENYFRKQTMANAERFITNELKNYEDKILFSERRRNDLEYEIFQSLLDKINSLINDILKTAKNVSIIDTLLSFAEVAIEQKYVRPIISDEETIELKNSRHPVVEKIVGFEKFVPNDIFIGPSTNRLLLVTGPNMAGKSTIMRQAALSVLMAQVGSFVPCESAVIGLCDKIFTRIGASDAIASGRSTFMVEMSEMARMLRNATSKSLLVIDEVGRGTSTFDGMSIAWAIIEDIHDRLNSRTLFSTHYHELTVLEKRLVNLQNFHVAVSEDKGDIVFLHRFLRGESSQSYGVHVAKLAGLPDKVVNRANTILNELEKRETKGRVHSRPEGKDQLQLF